MPVSIEPPHSATAVSDEQRMVMADMASVLLYVQGRFSMIGVSAFWSDAEVIASMKEQVEWAIERWESLSDANHATADRPHGPDTPPTDGPARTVEVSDRTGQSDPDLP